MSPAEKTRLELLAALSQLGRLRPEWRFGQTVANLATTAGRCDAGGVWDLEDDEALSAAQALIQQYTGMASEVAAADVRADRGPTQRSRGTKSAKGRPR